MTIRASYTLVDTSNWLIFGKASMVMIHINKFDVIHLDNILEKENLLFQKSTCKTKVFER